jgi:hypothetical protein
MEFLNKNPNVKEDQDDASSGKKGPKSAKDDDDF